MLCARIVYVTIVVLALTGFSNVHAISHPIATTPSDVMSTSTVITESSATQTVPVTPPTQAKEKQKRSKLQVNIACMQNAIEKRDNDLVAALDKYAVSVKAEIEKRKTDLKKAWEISEHKTRKEAVHKTWKSFKEAKRNLTMSMKKNTQEKWGQFRADVKKCYGSRNNGLREMQKTDMTTLRVDL